MASNFFMGDQVVQHNLICCDEDHFRYELSQFIAALASTPDLKSLSTIILEATLRAVGGGKGALFYLVEEKGEYPLIGSYPPTLQIDSSYVRRKEDPVVQALLEHGKILARGELEKQRKVPGRNDFLERMSLPGTELIIPLLSKGKLMGMIDVGPKTSLQPYTDQEMNWLGTVANLAAIALENRRLSEDLRRSKSHVQRADRLASLGTLTAALAHELRNPLVAIKTFTQLLPERLDDEEFRNHFLHIVTGEVDRITSLVNELLEFARPTDPKVERENINAILDSVILLVSTGTKKKHIHILKEFSIHLPPVLVDREQIKQVFLNLLINAIEATPENGRVHVQTRCFSKSNGSEYVQIEFKDTGCGIPSEHLESIFNPFFTTKHKGSGLGLSISNQIIQDHKGTIDVESQVNQGSIFYVNLPLR